MNRMAIACGWYWWLTDHHEGQWSRRYRRLCKLADSYRPGPLERGPSDFEAQMVYDQLCDREGCTHDRLDRGTE